jgi:hypothetical protein
MIPAIGTALQAAWPRGSYSHAVLSEQPYRGRLRSFLAHLLDEGDVRADGQTPPPPDPCGMSIRGRRGW